MGKYFIKTTNTGIKFDLKTSDDHVLGTSEVYGSEKAVLNGIESVRKNSLLAEINGKKNPKFEVYNDKSGKFRFRLLARNGRNILASEAFDSEAACLNGVATVKKNSDSKIIKE